MECFLTVFRYHITLHGQFALEKMFSLFSRLTLARVLFKIVTIYKPLAPVGTLEALPCSHGSIKAPFEALSTDSEPVGYDLSATHP